MTNLFLLNKAAKRITQVIEDADPFTMLEAVVTGEEIVFKRHLTNVTGVTLSTEEVEIEFDEIGLDFADVVHNAIDEQLQPI